jgi:glycosyltransferase involved in cell wall biosynthesis
VSAARIAVLISTYNGAAFLGAQLDSLLAQEGVQVEAFARDDGSSDATLGILARYAVHWPHLAAPITGPNLGPARSFLALLAAAPDGFDAYAFCDQDDVWLADKLARAARALARADGPALYCSNVLCVDAALRPLGEQTIGGDARFEHLLFENIAFGNTVVLNPAARALIAGRAPERGVIMFDGWCALVVSAFGRVFHDDWAGVLYRQHGANVIGASPGRLRDFFVRLRAFVAAPRRFYPIRAQAAAFLEAYGPDLSPARRRAVEALARSGRSLAARIAYALTGRVVRRRLADALAVRALILLGWY